MAGERLAYALLGSGRWAAKIKAILESGQRTVTPLAHTRQEPRQSREAYTAHLAAALRTCHAQVVWLCVAPGPHVACMMEAALAAGVHAIAEKPWLCSAQKTEALAAAAEKSGIRLVVHFEYCLLDEVEAWRAHYHNSSRLRFGGAFAIRRPGPSAIPPLQNLGSHLLAIRRYAVPNSEILELACAYNSLDERRVWVETATGLRDELDFLCTRQPIIQRFIRKFEAAIDGADFPFGIDFASGVASDLLKWRGPQTTAFHQP